MIKHNFCANTSANIILKIKHSFKVLFEPQHQLSQITGKYLSRGDLWFINKHNYKDKLKDLFISYITGSLIAFCDIFELGLVVSLGIGLVMLAINPVSFGYLFNIFSAFAVNGNLIAQACFWSILGFVAFCAVLSLGITYLWLITRPLWKPIQHAIRSYVVNTEDAMLQKRLGK